MRRYAGADEAGLPRIVRRAARRRAAAPGSCPRPIRQIRRHRGGRAPHDPDHRHRSTCWSQPLAGLFDEVVASRLHARDGRLLRLPRVPAAGRRGAGGVAAPVRRARPGIDLAELLRLRRQLLRPAVAGGGRHPGRGQPGPAALPARQDASSGAVAPVDRLHAADRRDDRGDGEPDDPHARVPPLAGPLPRRPHGDRAVHGGRTRGCVAANMSPLRLVNRPDPTAARRRAGPGCTPMPVRHLRLRPRAC